MESIMTSDDEFNYAINVVLQHEGGETNNPNDKGGLTNFGITQQFIIDNDITKPECARSYISMLTKQKAITLYKHYIWDKFHYGLIAPLEIATKVFDMTVNMGDKESHMLLQRSINTMSHEQLLVDGIMGVKTFSAANLLPPSYLHEELRQQQKQFYENVVKRNPQDNEFLEGWLKRAAW